MIHSNTTFCRWHLGGIMVTKQRQWLIVQSSLIIIPGTTPILQLLVQPCPLQKRQLGRFSTYWMWNMSSLSLEVGTSKIFCYATSCYLDWFYAEKVNLDQHWMSCFDIKVLLATQVTISISSCGWFALEVVYFPTSKNLIILWVSMLLNNIILKRNIIVLSIVEFFIWSV